jgi:hypothetical protein
METSLSAKRSPLASYFGPRFSERKFAVRCFGELAAPKYGPNQEDAAVDFYQQSQKTFDQNSQQGTLTDSHCSDLALGYLALEKAQRISARERAELVLKSIAKAPQHETAFLGGAYNGSYGLPCHANYRLMWVESVFCKSLTSRKILFGPFSCSSHPRIRFDLTRKARHAKKLQNATRVWALRVTPRVAVFGKLQEFSRWLLETPIKPTPELDVFRY